MEQLTRADIFNYLELINNELKKVEKHGNIVIGGGAALALVYGARESTQDIDAIFDPKEEFQKIIKNIAKTNNLNDAWLNDGLKGFVTDKMTTNIVKEYDHLTVSSFSAESLLAMKLTSARTISKDMDDAVTLMSHLRINNIKQLYDAIDKYTAINLQTPKVQYFTQEAFEKYQNYKQNLEMRQVASKHGFGAEAAAAAERILEREKTQRKQSESIKPKETASKQNKDK